VTNFDATDRALMKLQESGKLNELKEKWWKKNGVCANNEESEERYVKQAGIADLGK